MSTHPATILVVDDDPIGRATFAFLLQDAGYVVREADTGEAALRLTADLRPHLVVLDVLLPDLEGYEVCRRLKADPRTGTTLVLLVSGLGRQPVDRVVGLEGGADGYLAKPVDSTELVAQVRALLRARQAEETLARDALLLASVRDAIVVTDLTGIVTYWNEGATRLFGWQAAEMVGRPFAERFPEQEGRQVYSPGTGGERQDFRKDGSRVWVEVHVSRIVDSADRLVGILRLTHDISERKRAEAERESLIARLREALAAVKTLRGLLPICAWCKQIRTDSGYWAQLEGYLQEHLDVSFTHGICPGCAEKVLSGGLDGLTPP